DALCSRRVIGRRHHCFEGRFLDDVRDLLGVRGDDEAVANAELGETASDNDDEGFATQWQEWLAREPAGAQPCRNHAKDGHGGRYKICAVESSPRLPVVGQLDLAAVESRSPMISETVQTRSVSPA